LNREAFVTSAEVLQELVHRYTAIRAWVRGREVFEGFAGLMSGRTESIHGSDVEYAASLIEAYPGLQGRDLLHLAVMHRLGVTRIISADTGLDRVPEFERLDPARLAEWRDSI
jgi:predicted nucleic acid-binding protein